MVKCDKKPETQSFHNYLNCFVIKCKCQIMCLYELEQRLKPHIHRVIRLTNDPILNIYLHFKNLILVALKSGAQSGEIPILFQLLEKVGSTPDCAPDYGRWEHKSVGRELGRYGSTSTLRGRSEIYFFVLSLR